MNLQAVLQKLASAFEALSGPKKQKIRLEDVLKEPEIVLQLSLLSPPI